MLILSQIRLRQRHQVSTTAPFAIRGSQLADSVASIFQLDSGICPLLSVLALRDRRLARRGSRRPSFADRCVSAVAAMARVCAAGCRVSTNPPRSWAESVPGPFRPRRFRNSLCGSGIGI